ncbi:MAG: HD domain-containing protein, partial [Nitrospirae bacterium]
PAQLAPLRERGVERITFDAETTPEEVAALLDALTGEAPPAEALSRAGVTAIRVGRMTVEGGRGRRRTLAELYNELYRNAAYAVRDLLNACRERGVVDPGGAEAAVSEVVAREGDEATGLLDLTNLPRQEGEAFSHALNTCILAVALGRSLGLERRQLHDLGVAALLHDIGKQRLPERVRHPEGLDAEGLAAYQRHPQLGANLLRRLPGVGNLAARVALEHHVGYDRSGFPRLREATRLHLASHVVAIADAYDNLRTRGAAEEEMTCERALRLMAREVGRRFEPTLLKRFVDEIGLYPRGTLVLLSDGRLALVARTRPGHPLTPAVLVIRDAEGHDLSEPEPLDLYEEAQGPEPVTILESRDARLHGVEPLDYLG